MDEIESIIQEVDSSMAMEGMPLFPDDKDRIRKCLTNREELEDVIRSLVRKHTQVASRGK